MAKTLEVSLTWKHDLVFDTHLGSGPGPTLDGSGTEAASPMHAVAVAFGACMGIDVVNILKKGRHDLRALSVKVVGARADGPPSYFTAWTLHYEITGPVPEAAIERAIALSRETYCSVWHSLRQDAPLEVTYTRVDG